MIRTLAQRGSLLRNFTDEELCRRAATADGAAFDELFDRYWDRVFRLTLAIVRSAADAEDVTQAVFVELHCRAREFNEARGKFGSWLLRYAYTRAIDHKRYLQTRKYYDHCSFEDIGETATEGPIPTFRLLAEERSRLVVEMLEHVNEKQRIVIHAYFIEGRSLQEIAGMIDETHGNARHLLYRGLARLRDLLQPAAEVPSARKAVPADLKGVALARARAF